MPLARVTITVTSRELDQLAALANRLRELLEEGEEIRRQIARLTEERRIWPPAAVSPSEALDHPAPLQSETDEPSQT